MMPESKLSLGLVSLKGGEPDLMGMVLKVVVVIDLEGGTNKEPLLEAELPKGWVPPEGMT